MSVRSSDPGQPCFLDCKGWQCPKPIVQLSKLLRTLEPGDTVEVEADDLAFRADLEAWISMRPDRLVRLEEFETLVRAVIQKQARPSLVPVS